MEFVTAWEVIGAMASKIEVSEVERASTLRLGEEVAKVQDPGAPSPFRGKTMGELRDEVITSLARSFARANQLSSSAARLEYVLHHADASHPKLFDLRQTGLPRLSMSAMADLRPALFRLSKFEDRLVAALSAGRFRDFPKHGGVGGVGLSADDWRLHPSDGETLRKLAFLPEEIQPLLIEAGIQLGDMQDAFTGGLVKAIRYEVVDFADLELAPWEPVERASSESVPEHTSLTRPGRGRTPRRFTDEDLDILEQRHRNGEPWKKIAAELKMLDGSLERHITEHRKRKRKAPQTPLANPLDQLANKMIDREG